jgi:hypothetical protein
MTAQISENLIFEGEETSMAFCPPLPEHHPRIVETPNSRIETTACWRGYIGTWEIRNGSFYLVKVVGGYEMTGEEPILADWFTGVIRIRKGKLLHYIHMGFGSVFEQEIHVKIKNGKVVTSRVIDNRGKSIDELELGWRNLPGGENRFEGDDEI